ncbi:hypothetical protein SLA2020_274600 [Shorea laevis]
MESPKNFSYLSEPTSPSRCTLEMINNMYFYSVPTSPICRGVSASFGFEAEPASPRTFEDANSSFDDDEFEFETSRRFNVKDNNVENKQEF